MNKKLPFYRSISFVIAFLLVFITAIVLTVITLRGANSVEKYVERYYEQQGYILAEDVGNLIRIDYQEENPDRIISDRLAEYIEAIIRETGAAESLYVEVADQRREKGQRLLFTEKKENTVETELSGNVENWHSLSEIERGIYKGETASGTDRYSYKNEEYMTTMYGVHDSCGRTIAIVGVDLSLKDLGNYDKQILLLPSILRVIGFALLLLVIVLAIRGFLLKPLLLLSDSMRNFVSGDRLQYKPVEVRGESELAHMAEDFNCMAAEVKGYLENVKEAADADHASKAEMKVAYEIQMGLQPSEFYMDEDLRIDALMHPARIVGGDFYDYFPLDEDRMCFVIADVSGKGPSAAVFMASAITAIRYNLKRRKSPALALAAANNDLSENNPRQMFVTAFLAVYNRKTATLTYSNAGHNPPYLVGERLQKLQGARGLVLGEFPDEEYQEELVAVKDSDILYLYTDGVNEATDPQRKLFGSARLEAVLLQAAAESPALNDRVYRELLNFRQDAEQNDDITMMSVSFQKSWSLAVEAGIGELKKIKPFFIENECIPQRLRKKLYLAAEEIFVNIVSYAYKGVREDPAAEEKLGNVDPDFGVLLELYIAEGQLHMNFTDAGKPYNPLEEVITAGEYAEEMTIGGLGKMLAFQIVDDVRYFYRDGKNVLMMTKALDDEKIIK